MITLILEGLSLVSLAVVFFLAPEMSAWWLIPLFIGFSLIWILLYFIFILVSSWCLNTENPSPRTVKFSRWMIRHTLSWLFVLCNVRVKWVGKEKIPNGPAVFVSNHISAFDPMVVLAHPAGKRILFISKEENFKIPMAGPYIKAAGFLAIDRENAMKAMRTMKKASDVMAAEGVNVGIYPEGTRSKTGELGEFKGGAFFLAKRANAPIAVVSTEGTEKIKKRAPFRRTEVVLTVLDVMDAETVKEKTLDEIAEDCRILLLRKLGK